MADPRDPHDPQSRRARLRRLRVWLLGVGVTLVLVASVVVVVSIGLARMAPTWWRTIRPNDQATIDAAESIENDVVNTAYRLRTESEEPWAVALRAPDANAWLNTRLGQWLANADAEFEWPDELRDLQVEFDEGLVHIGLLVREGERSQVLSASLRPEIREDGSLWVRVESMALGRLPIPAGWVVGRADEHWPEALPARLLEQPMTQRVLSALTGDEPLQADPVLDLGDGRRVRLLDIDPVQGQLRVTCRTEFEE